jgi:hypothetical protein
MKKTLFLLALAASPLVQGAVSVTGTNLVLGPTSVADSMLITDNTGIPVSGSWAAGIFDAPDFSGPAGITSTFTQNGSDGAFSATPGVFGALGGVPITDAATSVDSSDNFAGKPVYIVVGNAASIAGSTDFVVFQTATNWPQEVQGVGAGFGVNIAKETLVYGIPTTVQGATGITSALNGDGGVTFGLIPEPSTSLLAGLAGLALMIRRKR